MQRECPFDQSPPWSLVVAEEMDLLPRGDHRGQLGTKRHCRRYDAGVGTALDARREWWSNGVSFREGEQDRIGKWQDRTEGLVTVVVGEVSLAAALLQDKSITVQYYRTVH
jgi:hypothetical protein